MELQTKILAVDEPIKVSRKPTVPAIYQTVMCEYDRAEKYHDLQYMRLSNNPNHEILNKKIGEIEGAEASLVCASGMATIAPALLTVLKSGDHSLPQNCLYGGTMSLISIDLPDLGISYNFIDARNSDSRNSFLNQKRR